MEKDYNENNYGPITTRFKLFFENDFVVIDGNYTSTIYVKAEWFHAYLFSHEIHLYGKRIHFIDSNLKHLNSSVLRFIFRNIDKFNKDDEYGHYIIHYEDFLSLLETQKIV